jgi:hypothetical protein
VTRLLCSIEYCPSSFSLLFIHILYTIHILHTYVTLSRSAINRPLLPNHGCLPNDHPGCRASEGSSNRQQQCRRRPQEAQKKGASNRSHRGLLFLQKATIKMRPSTPLLWAVRRNRQRMLRLPHYLDLGCRRSKPRKTTRHVIAYCKVADHSYYTRAKSSSSQQLHRIREYDFHQRHATNATEPRKL